MIEDHKISELIRLEAIGNIGPEDSADLLKLMNYRKDFPWKELGELQNLIALLAIAVEEELPSVSVKEKLFMQLGVQPTPEKEPVKSEIIKPETESLNISDPTEKKYHGDSLIIKEPDLSELSIFNHAKDFEEVKSRASVIRDKQNENTDLEKPSKIREFMASDYYKDSSGKVKGTINRNVMMILSIFLIAAIGIGFVYLVSSSDDQEIENQSIEDHNEMLISKSEEDFEKPSSTTLAENVSVVEQQSDIIVEPELIEEEISEHPLVEEELGKMDTSGMWKRSGIEPPTMIVTPLSDPNENEKDKIVTEEKLTSLTEMSPPSREKVELENEPTYFVAVEEMPEPIGGLKAIQEKITYPEIARRAGVEGKVFVLAFIDETGTVTTAVVTKGIGMGCDEAAIDAVLNTKFKPGMQRGKPVKVQVTVPITFKHK